MKIHLNSLPTILSIFIEQHIMSQAQAWDKVINIAAITVLTLKPDSVFTLINNKIGMDIISLGTDLGFIDSNGNIDMDLVKEILLKSVRSNNGKLPPIVGYEIEESDINLIYNLAEQYKVVETVQPTGVANV